MSEYLAPLRVGIVGAGQLASTRVYPSLRYAPVELTAVCDLDTDRAALIGGRFGNPAIYSSYRAMLTDAGLDAVIACVGAEVHHDIALLAMDRGIPVYTEKPPARTAEAANELAEVSRKSGVLCMTGFKKRFAPAYAKVRAAIDSGEFGSPSLVSIHHSAGTTYTPGATDSRASFLLDFGVHAIDLARFLGGEVDEVSAIDCGDIAYAITLRYASGAVGTISISAHQSWEVGAEDVHVHGAPGAYANVRNSVSMRRYQGEEIVDWNEPNFSTAGGDSLMETGFAAELVAFFNAVRTGSSAESTVASAAATMRLYEAIVESARTNSPVPVGVTA